MALVSGWERFVTFTLYEIVFMLYYGTIGFINEFFCKLEKLDYEALPKRSGQTAVITGGARGIGFQVVKRLLQMDYNVVLGVRNPDAGYKAIETIRKAGVNSGSAQCIQLDLKSLKSVRRFSKDVLQQTEKIHLLINNAGIMFTPYELTEDKNEVQFQVNHLGHFLITQALLPKMKSTAKKDKIKCRIINVSSLGHMISGLKSVRDAANPKSYYAFKSYCDSKLCQVLLTKHLDAQLQAEDANINVFALHPGIIPTDLYNYMGLIGKFVHLIKVMFRSVEDGAEIVMHAALSPNLENKGGSYLSDQKVTKPSSFAENLALQQELWDVSQDLINRNR